MCLYVSKLKHWVKVTSKHHVVSNNFQVKRGSGKWASSLHFTQFTKQLPMCRFPLWKTAFKERNCAVFCRLSWHPSITVDAIQEGLNGKLGREEKKKKAAPDSRVIKRDECPSFLFLTLDCKRSGCMHHHCKNMIEQFHFAQRNKQKKKIKNGRREWLFDQSFKRQELSCMRWHVPPLLLFSAAAAS